MAHQSKPTNFPSKPVTQETTCAGKTSSEAKWRRQDNDCDDSLLKSLTINPKTNQHGPTTLPNHNTIQSPILEKVTSTVPGPTKSY